MPPLLATPSRTSNPDSSSTPDQRTIPLAVRRRRRRPASCRPDSIRLAVAVPAGTASAVHRSHTGPVADHTGPAAGHTGPEARLVGRGWGFRCSSLARRRPGCSTTAACRRAPGQHRDGWAAVIEGTAAVRLGPLVWTCLLLVREVIACQVCK